jgi:class 3 adenylate cyclase
MTVLRLALIQARGLAMLRGAYLSTSVRVLLATPGHTDLRELSPGTTDLDRLLAGWPDLGRADSIWSGRQARALVFGDVKGFSRISEKEHVAFLRVIVGGFADALATLNSAVEYAETAGDGLYVVLTDVATAVRACHALHRAVVGPRLLAAGLPEDLGLRLSAHVGPVFHGLDRVTGREKFFGKEVIRTARIEPITPPGETYVTEQFASALCCVTGGIYDCEYVGRQPMAKGFGECRMYTLRETRRRTSTMISTTLIASS